MSPAVKNAAAAPRRERMKHDMTGEYTMVNAAAKAPGHLDVARGSGPLGCGTGAYSQGREKTLSVPAAACTTYCLPLRAWYVIGVALPVALRRVTNSSLPVFESMARKRASEVVPMKISPPAVAIGPDDPPRPVFCFSGGSPSVMPSGICHANSPVAAFTAVRRPHGGRWQGPCGSPCPIDAANSE